MMRRACAIVGAIAFVVLAGSGSIAARADAPRQLGWWTATNPGAIAGVALPSTAPDVPAGGLLVEGGVGSAAGTGNGRPTAFAALVYDLTDGRAADSLTLAVVAGSASTPNATLELCPLVNSGIQAEMGGPMDHAPQFDCTRNVTAAPSAAGDGYAFAVDSVTTDGVMAVAVLPTNVTDRVVLAPPADDSLKVASAIAYAATPESTAIGGAPVRAPVTTASRLPVRADKAPVRTVAAAAAPATPQETRPAAARSALPLSAPASASAVAVGAIIVVIVVGGTLWTTSARAAARAAARDAQGEMA